MENAFALFLSRFSHLCCLNQLSTSYLIKLYLIKLNELKVRFYERLNIEKYPLELIEFQGSIIKKKLICSFESKAGK